MPHTVARRAAAFFAGATLLLTACGDPATPRRLDLAEADLLASPMPLPSLDVVVPAPLGPDALFTGLRDRPSRRRDLPDKEAQRSPRRFQVGQEPDETRESATHIELSGEVWGWVHPPISDDQADVDWYEATADLEAPRSLTVELDPVEGCDLSLELWHQGFSGDPKRVARADAYGAGQGEHLGNVALTNGRWFLRVSSGKAGAGFPWNVRDPYLLRFRVEDVDGGHELEPDDDERRANPVLPDHPMEATLHLGDEDWFRIDVSRFGLDSRLALDILPDPGLALRWEVITQDRVTVLGGEAEKGGRIHVPNLGVSEGLESFYVVVRAPEALEGMAQYTISTAVHPLDGRTELEPNDSISRATTVPVPSTVTGWLHDGLDRDLYRVLPGDAGAVRIDLDGVPGVLPALELLDATGEVMGSIQPAEAGAGLSLPNWSPPAEGGWIALRAVEGASPLTPYSLAIQVRDTSGEEAEPNDSPELASLVNPDQDGLQGYIAFAGDRDCYGLPVGAVPPGGGLEVSIEERGDRGIRGTFYGRGGVLVEQVTISAGDRERVHLTPESGGPMTLCIESTAPSGSPGQHGYRVTAIPVAPEPLEDGR
ncbi:MAG: hypothetical protein ABIK09_00280 [Pseudomonadota bacterium]